MKKYNDRLFALLREYFTVFMPIQKKSSPHTILAAKQVWNMLLSFICAKTGNRVEALSLDDFSRDTVLHFLGETQRSKGWAPATRNQRLARIRSFFRYVADIESTFAIYFEKLIGIPLQKDVKGS